MFPDPSRNSRTGFRPLRLTNHSARNCFVSFLMRPFSFFTLLTCLLLLAFLNFFFSVPGFLLITLFAALLSTGGTGFTTGDGGGASR